METAAAVDGRFARGMRARAVVIDAYLDLLNEGDLRPTAARVARRAGVSLRLVFHHYADMEALYAAAADRQTERMFPLIRPIPHTLPLALRVEALIAQRTRLLETIAPVRRAALLKEPFSTTIARRLSESRALMREQVERVFSPELAAVSPAERNELRAALDAATGFPIWETLRRHQGLRPERARRVMKRMVEALLTARIEKSAPVKEVYQ